MSVKMEKIERRRFNAIGGVIVIIVALFCVLPMVMVFSGSISDEDTVLVNGYSVLPQGFSLNAYRAIFRNSSSVLRAYRNTIIVTVLGTGAGLFLTAMTAYVLQRKDFLWRNVFAYFLYFTTLFSGGLVPWYLLMVSLGFRNSIFAMIIPHLFSVFNILVMRNFMNSIPGAITESGKIDGANDFIIFIRLILPLSSASLATIGLFLALAYWNEWYNCMLMITDEKLYSLQYYLYNMLNADKMLKQMITEDSTGIFENMTLPGETAKLAMTIIATGPIVLVYPFIQRYFVKGITIGAVKG